MEKKYLLIEDKSGVRTSEPSAPRPASRGRLCLVMAACLYLQAVVAGSAVAMSVQYAELIAVFGARRSQVAVLQGLYVGLVNGGGVFFSPIVKSYGPGPSVIACTSLGVAALCVTYVLQDLAAITVTVGVIASLGFSVSLLASCVSISWLFHEDPGLALAFVSIGSSLGQCILPYVMEVFVDIYRWQGAFLLLGGVALQCVPCACYIYTCREFYKTGMDEKKTSFVASIKRICDVSLYTDVVFVLVVINSVLLTVTGKVPWFFVDILPSRGLSRDKGSYLLSVLGFGTVIGRILGFLIKFKINVKAVCHWVYMWPLISLCYVLCVTVTSYPRLIVVCLIYGVAYGTAYSLLHTITLDVCGLARYPQGAALVNLMDGVGSFIGYLCGGIIKDTTGSYDPAFYVASGAGLYISLTSAIVATLLRRRDATVGEQETCVSSQYKTMQ